MVAMGYIAKERRLEEAIGTTLSPAAAAAAT